MERLPRRKKANKRQNKREVAKRLIIKLIRDDLMPITGACKAAMIGSTTYYAWLKSDPQFASDVEAARAECMRKLIELVKKDRGGPMKLLAAMFREEFGERVAVDVKHRISRLEIVNDREDALPHTPSQAGPD